MRTISSRQNPIVRMFRDLAERADPRGTRVLLDGAHLVRDAHAARASVEIAAVAASRLTDDTEERRLADLLERQGTEVVVAPDAVFAAMSPVRSPSGIAAIARRDAAEAQDICRVPNAFVLTAVDVQDPGNIGSLLRAAEAGGVTGALVCATPGGSAANPFSWKALRGSMGSALRLPVAGGLTAAQALDALSDGGVRSVAAVPHGGCDPDTVRWPGSVALVLGGEGPGLGADVIARCIERVTIPMAPAVESLNVAVAGAVIIYAARRQRGS
jgi:TrmH family RNA methyltransferase